MRRWPSVGQHWSRRNRRCRNCGSSLRCAGSGRRAGTPGGGDRQPQCRRRLRVGLGHGAVQRNVEQEVFALGVLVDLGATTSITRLKRFAARSNTSLCTTSARSPGTISFDGPSTCSPPGGQCSSFRHRRVDLVPRRLDLFVGELAADRAAGEDGATAASPAGRPGIAAGGAGGPAGRCTRGPPGCGKRGETGSETQRTHDRSPGEVDGRRL